MDNKRPNSVRQEARIVERHSNGVVVRQITHDSQEKNNIYCERSYCAPDSRFFVFQRRLPRKCRWENKFQAEFIACAFATGKTWKIGEGISYPEVSPQGGFFYTRDSHGTTRELVRADLLTAKVNSIPVSGGVRPLTGMAVSPDERYLAYGVALSYRPQMFGIELVDLKMRTRRMLYRDPFIFNPHLQFEPARGRYLLVQHNREYRFLPNDRSYLPVGAVGATLFLLSMPDGKKTCLPVGLPYTTKITGHEDWIGNSGQILLTVNGPWNDGIRRGNLLAVGAAQPTRVVTPGGHYAHVNTSVCGRFFCCDRFRQRPNLKSGAIVIGSIKTGKTAVLCRFPVPAPRVLSRYGQSSDAHPYLSPNCRWVVYNDCRSGKPQICIVNVPGQLLTGLLKR